MKKTSKRKRTHSGRRRRARPSRRARRSRTDSAAPTQWRRHGTALPSWKELEREQTSSRRSSDGFLERISTVRFALAILALAALFTLYVGHVHATQDLVARVQEARQVNRSLHLKHNRLKGAFDRATGPAVIQRRAQELGLEENLAYGPPITVEDE
jgi:hypothetical protein